jgi:hypothetical protein
MPLAISHHLLNVFVQLANKRGLTKKYICLFNYNGKVSTIQEPQDALPYLMKAHHTTRVPVINQVPKPRTIHIKLIILSFVP